MQLPFVIRHTALAVCILLNSACAIGIYSPTEPTKKLPVRVSAELDFLFFSHHPMSRDQQEIDPRKLPWATQRVKDLLEKYSKFKTAIPALSAPARGTYITFYETDRSRPQTMWETVNLWTLFVVPCALEYEHESHFDVYVDNVLQRSYRYDIHWKGVSWIGLGPFFWVNLILADREDAFSANASQFIADAKQDGLL